MLGWDGCRLDSSCGYYDADNGTRLKKIEATQNFSSCNIYTLEHMGSKQTVEKNRNKTSEKVKIKNILLTLKRMKRKQKL